MDITKLRFVCMFYIICAFLLFTARTKMNVPILYIVVWYININVYEIHFECYSVFTFLEKHSMRYPIRKNVDIYCYFVYIVFYTYWLNLNFNCFNFIFLFQLLRSRFFSLLKCVCFFSCSLIFLCFAFPLLCFMKQ